MENDQEKSRFIPRLDWKEVFHRTQYHVRSFVPFSVTFRLLVTALTVLITESAALVHDLNTRFRQPRKIKIAPGTRLLSIAAFICSPETVKLTFEPIVAECQHEYFQALHKGELWKARWIRVRYTYIYLKAAGLSKLYSLIKRVGIITGIVSLLKKIIY